MILFDWFGAWGLKKKIKNWNWFFFTCQTTTTKSIWLQPKKKKTFSHLFIDLKFCFLSKWKIHCRIWMNGNWMEIFKCFFSEEEEEEEAERRTKNEIPKIRYAFRILFVFELFIFGYLSSVKKKMRIKRGREREIEIHYIFQGVTPPTFFRIHHHHPSSNSSVIIIVLDSNEKKMKFFLFDNIE